MPIPNSPINPDSLADCLRYCTMPDFVNFLEAYNSRPINAGVAAIEPIVDECLPHLGLDRRQRNCIMLGANLMTMVASHMPLPKVPIQRAEHFAFSFVAANARYLAEPTPQYLAGDQGYPSFASIGREVSRSAFETVNPTSVTPEQRRFALVGSRIVTGTLAAMATLLEKPRSETDSPFSM